MITPENIQLALQLIPIEFLNTLYMVGASAFFAILLGLPTGIFLYLTSMNGLQKSPWIYPFLSALVNIGRSIPFAILMVAIIPLTRFVVGTSLGTTASIVPLTLAAAPFMARIVERALREIDKGVLEAAIVIGSTTSQLVGRVLLPEALPRLISGMTLMTINLIGFSAMAGLVGGGGLGKIAIQYGYQRFNGFLMVTTLIVLLLLVEVVEKIGKKIVVHLEKKRGLL